MKKLMNKLMKTLMNTFMRKAIKIISISLILSLLLGWSAVYGIPYQGLDMPIRLHSNETIDWSESIGESDKLFVIKDKQSIKHKTIIFKAALGYIGETVQIGRGPPKNKINSFLVDLNLIERDKLKIKDLVIKT